MGNSERLRLLKNELYNSMISDDINIKRYKREISLLYRIQVLKQKIKAV